MNKDTNEFRCILARSLLEELPEQVLCYFKVPTYLPIYLVGTQAIVGINLSKKVANI
jgi:hypothetical protein